MDSPVAPPVEPTPPPVATPQQAPAALNFQQSPITPAQPIPVQSPSPQPPVQSPQPQVTSPDPVDDPTNADDDPDPEDNADGEDVDADLVDTDLADSNQDFTPFPIIPEEMRPQPEEMILEWQAPNRPFKKRNRQYYTTIAIIVFLISLILFFAGQFLPIAVVMAVGFLSYVLSAVPPEMIVNQFTTYGVRTDGQLYHWEELGRFWYGERFDQKLLHIEVNRFPNQLTLLLGNQTEEALTAVLSGVLLQEKPLPTAFDKATKWIEEKIPLDTDS